nr:DUF2470 domain-containing protein [Rhodococcus sp. (in: high G+C Gram-positive bacteria)]
MALDHGDPGDAPSTPPPLTEVAHVPRPTPAEEARTVAASTNIATLASLTVDGDPWASYITYGLFGGSPVLCVSRMAEHGRNLHQNPRASVSIVAPESVNDPLSISRVTLAGYVEAPHENELDAARAAHLAAVPAAKYYIDYSDFSLWILRVERARWVGGYGRMDSATATDYAAAAPDPVSPNAAGAVAHLNADHAESLLAMARVLGGYPDATQADCTSADRYGLDLGVVTPRGIATTRVGYANPIDDIGLLRAATVELARRARG